MFLFLLQGVVVSVLWKKIIGPEHIMEENYAENSLQTTVCVWPITKTFHGKKRKTCLTFPWHKKENKLRVLFAKCKIFGWKTFPECAGGQIFVWILRTASWPAAASVVSRN